jgi:hypothetical protein
MAPTRTTLATLLFAGLLVLLVPAGAGAGVVVTRVDRPAASVRDYWTKERMREAEPVPLPTPDQRSASAGPEAGGPPSYVTPALPGEPGSTEIRRGTTVGSGRASGIATPVVDPTATDKRMHGKVFFRLVHGPERGKDFVCSGTAINSRNRSLVMTAGHCIFDWEDRGRKVTNWAFVPAYNGADARPFGTWPAKRTATTRQWKRGENLRYDLGAAVVRRNPAGRRLQAVVGARGIGFDQPRRQRYDIFGYPVEGAFVSMFEYACTSPYRGSDGAGGGGPLPMRASCNMSGGSSGGGWVGGGALLSVVSYGYGTEPTSLFGPYLSKTAKKLYKRMRGAGRP